MQNVSPWKFRTGGRSRFLYDTVYLRRFRDVGGDAGSPMGVSLKSRTLLALLIPLVAVEGCRICEPYENSVANRACVPLDAGVMANQPFVVRAWAFSGGGVSPTCAVTVDGGSIGLAFSGVGCSSTNPVVSEAPVDCAIPALSAGRYTLTGIAGRDVALSIPLQRDVDGGVPTIGCTR